MGGAINPCRTPLRTVSVATTHRYQQTSRRRVMFRRVVGVAGASAPAAAPGDPWARVSGGRP